MSDTRSIAGIAFLAGTLGISAVLLGLERPPIWVTRLSLAFVWGGQSGSDPNKECNQGSQQNECTCELNPCWGCMEASEYSYGCFDTYPVGCSWITNASCGNKRSYPGCDCPNGFWEETDIPCNRTRLYCWQT